MRRNTLLLLVGAVAALAVACRDSIVAPARTPNTLSASRLPAFSKSGPAHDQTVIGTIELSPAGGTYHVGDFDVVMPAGAVCDPATTKYGVGHWNDDCTPAVRSVTVNVVAVSKHGQVRVDFTPDIRFRPSAGAVTIQTQAYRDLLTSGAVRQLSRSSSFFDGFVILYVPTRGQGVDEGRSASRSMVTHVDLSTGLVWRQIKHFSGYLISAGQKCDVTTADATTCIVDDSGLGGSGTVSSQLNTTTLSFAVSDTTSSVIVTP
jgi:hypothetical protein